MSFAEYYDPVPTGFQSLSVYGFPSLPISSNESLQLGAAVMLGGFQNLPSADRVNDLSLFFR